MLRRPVASPSKNRFGHFRRSLALWAVSIMVAFCCIFPALDVCIDAVTYRDGQEPGEKLTRLAQTAALRSRRLLEQGGHKTTLDLQLAVWRTELLASHQLDRDPDSLPIPSLWQEVQLGIVSSNGLPVATSGALTVAQDEKVLINKAKPQWGKTAGTWLLAAAPIGDKQKHSLLIRVHAPTNTRSLVQAAWRYLWLDLIETALLSILIAWLASWAATRPLIRRLEDIDTAVDGWAGGDFSTRAKETGRDDLALLTRRLNTMAGELEQFITLRSQMAAAGERERLLSELHDSVKQRMFALSMQLAAARAHTANENLQTAQELTVQMQRDLHRIIQPVEEIPTSLCPPEQALERLQFHANQWQRDGFDIELKSQLTTPIATSVWTSLEAIGAESLANAARHSGATQVKIELAPLPDGRLRLTVQDNGHGFQKQTVRPGRGLRSMETRAQALTAGIFALQADTGQGCRITVECQNTANA